MKVLVATAAAVVALVVGGCGDSGPSKGSVEANGGTTAASSAADRTKPKVEVPKGAPPKRLVVKDLIEGSGRSAETGDELTVEYIGVLYGGKKFTDSWERPKPFKFTLGSRSAFVDPSWRKGLLGMRVGGRRELIAPPTAWHAPPGTPPSKTLVYIIDLVAVNGRAG